MTLKNISVLGFISDNAIFNICFYHYPSPHLCCPFLTVVLSNLLQVSLDQGNFQGILIWILYSVYRSRGFSSHYACLGGNIRWTVKWETIYAGGWIIGSVWNLQKVTLIVRHLKKVSGHKSRNIVILTKRWRFL